jgi:hypothetical protein
MTRIRKHSLAALFFDRRLVRQNGKHEQQEVGSMKEEHGVSVRQSLRPITACLVISLACLSCGPKTGAHFNDPSFTQHSLTERGLAVGGMTWAVGESKGNASISAGLDTLLWQRLKQDLKETDVKPLTFVDSCIGESSRSNLLRYIVQKNIIEPINPDLRKIGDCGMSVYVVFGVLLDNQVYSAWAPATFKGGKDQNRVFRNIRANFTVYDASTGKLVWQGDVSAERSTSKDAPEEKGLVGDLVDILLPSAEPEFPDAPSISEVVWKVYAGLSDALRRMR